MVPADDEHTDSPEATSDTNKKEREPAHLTPIPDWLMKWWIPFALAGVLFCGSIFITSIWGSATYEEIVNAIQYFPKRWPFHMRTPSREEIEVCITITAAGFAFSGWQQRTHDNIARAEVARAKQEAEKTARETAEENRRKQIERNEYWKRREHIFHLLDSKNPGLRLGAVTLLAELADSTFHSDLLNPTEKQQLQRHIIDTLCLQVRHEGLNISSEGTTDEHAELQREIISAILTRVSQEKHHETLANWTEETISINNTNIITPLTISNTTIQTILDLSNTIFHNTLTIRESSINSIKWDSTQFNRGLIAHSSLIKTDSLPKYMESGRFTETRFLTKRERLALTFIPHNTSSSISFYECSFYNCECTCLTNCSCKLHTDDRTCTCIKNKRCACNNPCMFTDITIQDYDTTYHSAEDNQRLHSLFIHLNSCTMGALILDFHHAQSNASVQRNAIHGRLKIIDEEIQPHPIPSEYCTPELLRFNILDNTIIQAGYQNPVEINIRPKRSIDNFMDFYDNEYQTSNNSNESHPIDCVIDNSNDQPYLFKLTEQDTLDDHKIEWRTGGEY